MKLSAPRVASYVGLAFAISTATPAQTGDRPALAPPRITQQMIAGGNLSLREIRTHGLRVFASPFTHEDGYGDGPVNPLDPTSPGGRPMLQNNGTFLRVNGLDSQTCMECHSVMSSATVPFRFGIGGVGGSNNNAMAGPTEIDVDDSSGNGFAFYNGRYINPPFLFGSGGVELLGKEMTVQLQERKRHAQNNPGTPVALIANGIDFGEIVYRNGEFDTSGIEGIDDDLVVRPFGRKGEFATTRAFDIGALQFHLGMQPVEVVGQNLDDDGDGVVNEVLIGEVSALAIFNTNMERPLQRGTSNVSVRGGLIFETIGCADCHTPSLKTQSRILTYSFPEVETDPSANVYYAVDLTRTPAGFQHAPFGGITVPMFSDLKRHDMGPDLAESTGSPLDPFFITARLWGIADTAPYMHDGRSLTLTEAILAHGGEGQSARDAFVSLSPRQKNNVLTFLRTLRTPLEAAGDLDVRTLQGFTSADNEGRSRPLGGSTSVLIRR